MTDAYRAVYECGARDSDDPLSHVCALVEGHDGPHREFGCEWLTTPDNGEQVQP